MPTCVDELGFSQSFIHLPGAGRTLALVAEVSCLPCHPVVTDWSDDRQTASAGLAWQPNCGRAGRTRSTRTGGGVCAVVVVGVRWPGAHVRSGDRDKL